ncbi:MAG: 3-deoxy-D-manno-octulosonic acid transferase [Prevotellaceae bacterium]|jgi:3-deoxy-D-manno-octulosonic-acid transferase|nr:3-deoxy-D-manno-octulosonic acid transferase [Prevotellaceae bacterium]
MYTVITYPAYILAHLAYPFNRKIRNWLRGQHGNIDRVKKLREKDTAPLVWIHCASLGEFEQGKPLLEAFLKRHPEYKSMVTFFSPSGFIPSRTYRADIIAYIPWDTCFNAKAFLDAANPTIVFWIKYDYWTEHLMLIKKRNIPCYLISATFRPGQYFFKRVLKRLSPLRYFTHLFVQTEQSKRLLAAAGINNVTVTGDTRFDRVCKIASKNDRCSVVERFVRSSDKVLIAGSSWPKDEAIIAEAIKQLPDIKLILVPHEINPERIESSEQTFSFCETLRYTRAESGNPEKAGVLIVDTIGILSTIYRYADAAYIGCGFDSGIHNTLEAAVYGIPVTFGPKYDKFEEAKKLVVLGGATPINNAEELQLLLAFWFNGDNRERLKQGKICADYVEHNAGITEKILSLIDN